MHFRLNCDGLLARSRQASSRGETMSILRSESLDAGVETCGIDSVAANRTLYLVCVSPFISPMLSLVLSVSPLMASTWAFCTISASCFMSASIFCHAF